MHQLNSNNLLLNNLLSPPPPPPLHPPRPICQFGGQVRGDNFNYIRGNQIPQNWGQPRSQQIIGSPLLTPTKPFGCEDRQPQIPFSKPIHIKEELRDPLRAHESLKRPFTSEAHHPGLDQNAQYTIEINASSKITASTIAEKSIEDHVTLPKELTLKFGPLKCDLCLIEVNSTVQAKMHYSGKIHEKKIAQFMQKYAVEKGEPLAKRFKEGARRKKLAGGSESLHCIPCNLALTSQQHADQHLMGRNHKRALAAEGRQGSFLNRTTGKWQDPLPAEKPDPTGRFNIGKGFLNEISSDPLDLKSESDDDLQSSSNPFSCKLCHINTTSRDQLDGHYKGAKHLKAMKAAGDAWSIENQKIPIAAAKGDSILASLVGSNNMAKTTNLACTQKQDYSIYRTPSGYYYCNPCNLTLNSEPQFIQHCDSKKHKLKLASVKKSTPTTITPKVETI